MKTLRLALMATALVGSTAAIANTCSFSGFYAGGQIGMGTMNTHANGHTINTNPTFNVNEKFAATGVVGGLHLGYGKHFPNRVYMGVEAWGNLSGNKETHKITADTINGNEQGLSFKAERKNALGIAFRPGMVFGNTLVNAILGIESAKFKYSTSTLFNGVPTELGHSSKRRYGFVPGLEVSFHANDHVVLGLKATHTLYRKKDSIKTQATDVMAKASYKF